MRRLAAGTCGAMLCCALAAIGAAAPPLLEGKSLVAGAPALYVCRNFSCEASVTEAAQIEL